MPRLTLTNTLGSDVYVPDMTGRGQAFKVPPAGLVVDIPGVALEYMEPVLDALLAKGWLTFVTSDNPNISNTLEILPNTIARPILTSAVVPATAGATAVHASVFGDATGPVTLTTGITNPDVPRNLSVAFGATWDGGNVTVKGTNNLGAAITEVFTTGTSVTRTGVNAFATVTSIAYAGSGVGTHATNTMTCGTGNALGPPYNITNTTGILYVDNATSAVTISSTYDTYTPTTVPNGVHSYVLLCNIIAGD